MPRKQTRKEFIAKARAVHGDKYSYDKVNYITNKIPVVITCPVHGDFEMLPNNHTSLRQGCHKCEEENRKVRYREEFIERANVVHGGKYNYDKVIYKGWDEKVIIICPVHGNFEMRPFCHENGRGCPECAKERLSKLFSSDSGSFIAKATGVHGNKYSYDKVEYVKNDINVIITCPKHGDFPQLPYNHLNGSGCPKCNASHLEEKTRLLLEQNNIRYETGKTFHWLKNKRKMPLDFYLPEYNIAIECQGVQHYLTEGNGYFSDEDVLGTQQRDKLKFQLCKEHNIPIYYINYDENVEERINNLIKNVLRQDVNSK